MDAEIIFLKTKEYNKLTQKKIEYKKMLHFDVYLHSQIVHIDIHVSKPKGHASLISQSEYIETKLLNLMIVNYIIQSVSWDQYI